jgi:hypothetical protein
MSHVLRADNKVQSLDVRRFMDQDGFTRYVRAAPSSISKIFAQRTPTYCQTETDDAMSLCTGVGYDKDI